MWFDVPQMYGEDYGIPMVRMLRTLQPDILINNRAYAEAGRTSQFNQQTEVGDFFTPEQRIGGFDRQRPWETCMTIGKQWAWKPNEPIKSREQCLQTLLRTIGGDGNLLFNVGPMADGRIEPLQVERLAEMGAWLEPRAEAVYGTRGGPYQPGTWGASTCKNTEVFLSIMSWPETGPLVLPSLGAKIVSHQLIPAGTCTVTQEADRLVVDVAPALRDQVATVVKLTLETNAFGLPTVQTESEK
jgi:alpha-L-fucosidase